MWGLQHVNKGSPRLNGLATVIYHIPIRISLTVGRDVADYTASSLLLSTLVVRHDPLELGTDEGEIQQQKR